MTVLVIADDQLLLQHLPEVKADLVVSCGDLPDDIILRAAQRVRCSQIVAVKGNHDGTTPFPEPIVDLHLHSRPIFGLSFGGFAGAWKYKPKGHFLFEQSEVDLALAQFPRVDVFVAHNSPRMTHDTEDEVHLGFSAFIGYIERARPAFFLHGHQHVNRESTIAGTRVIGTYGHRFLVIQN